MSSAGITSWLIVNLKCKARACLCNQIIGLMYKPYYFNLKHKSHKKLFELPFTDLKKYKTVLMNVFM